MLKILILLWCWLHFIFDGVWFNSNFVLCQIDTCTKWGTCKFKCAFGNFAMRRNSLNPLWFDFVSVYGIQFQIWFAKCETQSFRLLVFALNIYETIRWHSLAVIGRNILVIYERIWWNGIKLIWRRILLAQTDHKI